MPTLKQTFTLVDGDREHFIGSFEDPLPEGITAAEMVENFKAAMAFRSSTELEELVNREVKKRRCSAETSESCGRCRVCRWKK